MANVQLFKTKKASGTFAGNVIKEAGGRAYAMSPKHAFVSSFLVITPFFELEN